VFISNITFFFQQVNSLSLITKIFTRFDGRRQFVHIMPFARKYFKAVPLQAVYYLFIYLFLYFISV